MTSEQRPTIDEIVVGDDPAAWAAAGFTVDDDGIARLGSVRVRLAGTGGGRGIREWTLRDVPDPGPGGIDGVATGTSDRPPPQAGVHPNGVLRIDHLVLISPDGQRTAEAITARTGLEVRRIRETDDHRTPMRQWFFRLGEVILELVEPSSPRPERLGDSLDAGDLATAGSGPAAFYGLALVAGDIDALGGFYGEAVGEPKAAVQPGRRIATLRHRQLDLSVPIAFMSPEPART